jgi:hypothetical protein
MIFNINVGDVINLIDNKPPLPIIHGKVLRGNFELKYPITITDKVKINGNYKILAGDYFSFPQFEIYEPRNLLNCLKNNCEMKLDSLLLESNSPEWNLYLESNLNCNTTKKIKDAIFKCPHKKQFEQAILNDIIKVNLLNEPPVDFLAERKNIIDEVRQGVKPKGILKKWPLYILLHNKEK